MEAPLWNLSPLPQVDLNACFPMFPQHLVHDLPVTGRGLIGELVVFVLLFTKQIIWDVDTVCSLCSSSEQKSRASSSKPTKTCYLVCILDNDTPAIVAIWAYKPQGHFRLTLCLLPYSIKVLWNTNSLFSALQSHTHSHLPAPVSSYSAYENKLLTTFSPSTTSELSQKVIF